MSCYQSTSSISGCQVSDTKTYICQQNTALLFAMVILPLMGGICVLLICLRCLVSQGLHDGCACLAAQLRRFSEWIGRCFGPRDPNERTDQYGIVLTDDQYEWWEYPILVILQLAEVFNWYADLSFSAMLVTFAHHSYAGVYITTVVLNGVITLYAVIKYWMAPALTTHEFGLVHWFFVPGVCVLATLMCVSNAPTVRALPNRFEYTSKSFRSLQAVCEAVPQVIITGVFAANNGGFETLSTTLAFVASVMPVVVSTTRLLLYYRKRELERIAQARNQPQRPPPVPVPMRVPVPLPLPLYGGHSQPHESNENHVHVHAYGARPPPAPATSTRARFTFSAGGELIILDQV
jgi:hypothetical protein